jgi:hypothetical protein
MTRRVSMALVLPLLSLGLLAGCGGSGSATGDKTAFCADNAKLDAASNGVTTPAAAMAALEANKSTIVDFGKNAPPDIKKQADILVTTSLAAIAANDPSKIENNTAYAAAGSAVDAYCGQGSNGSSTTGTTTSGTTT